MISRRAFHFRPHLSEIAIRSGRAAAACPSENLPSVLAVRFGAFDRPFAGGPVAHLALFAGYERAANAGDSTACSPADLVPESPNANPGAAGSARRSGTDERAGRGASTGGSLSRWLATCWLGNDGLMETSRTGSHNKGVEVLSCRRNADTPNPIVDVWHAVEIFDHRTYRSYQRSHQRRGIGRSRSPI